MAVEGQADLTAVTMSGQLQIDRVVQGNVCKIGAVGQQQHAIVRRNGFQRFLNVRLTVPHIFYAAQPYIVFASIKGDGLVVKDLKAAVGQNFCDFFGSLP